jgi:cytidyltransferase-like protein
MTDLQVSALPALEPGAVITCLLGSYDPVHRGHLWMMRRMLSESDALLVLVPERHFDKDPRPGFNATTEQRLEMLRLLPYDVRARAGFGRTRVVLFAELLRELESRWPAQQLRFAMGDDTYRRMLRSRAYYREVGRRFGAAERARVARLAETTRVFARHRSRPDWITVPDEVVTVSSTRVRRLAVSLHGGGASLQAWRGALRPLVTAPVAAHLYRERIYRRLAQAPATPNGRVEAG